MDGPLNITMDDNTRRHLQALIRQQLAVQTGNETVDDVLPEYVMVMVANQKTKSQVAVDLEAFLGPSSAAFTNWLWEALHNFSQGVNQAAPSQPSSVAVNNKPLDARSPLPPSISLPSTISAPPQESVFASVISVPPRAERTRSNDHPAPSRLILNAVQDAVNSIGSTNKDVIMADEEDRNRPPSRKRTGRDHREREYRERGSYRERERNNEVDHNHNHNHGGARKNEESTVTFTVTLNGAPDEPARAGSKRRSMDSSSSGATNGKSLPLGSVPLTTTSSHQNGDTEELLTDGDGSKKSKKQKCQFWPACKRGDACMYVHPTVQCTSFPNCPYGTECIFIHPSIPCKFGVKCTRTDCAFNHPPGRGAVAKQGAPCKYGYACPRSPCTFVHPPEACRYGEACSRPDCAFAHGKPCRFGVTCATPGCTFVHQQPQTSIPTTPIPVPCKFGSKCTNANCRFQHDPKDTEMAEADANASVATLSASLPLTPPQQTNP